MTPRDSTLSRIFITALATAIAVPVGLGMRDHYIDAPWTRDGYVRADVVAAAPDVSGLLEEVLIEDNQVVRKGDVMLRLNQERFRLAVRQAEAAVANREGAAERAASDRSRHDKLTEVSFLSSSARASEPPAFRPGLLMIQRERIWMLHVSISSDQRSVPQ